MAIDQLSDEQIRTMTLEEKDTWWFTNVFKGDMPQLTLRSGLTGMALGGILSLTNLYVGIKTGWTLGVGITSVILAFSLFKIMSRINLGDEMTLLENNAMQSIATASGYMTAPLISSISAYMLVTGKVVPMLHTMIWVICLSILGVLFAFPLKRRFINDEQMPFPEGRACGIVMANLHSDSGAQGMFKSKLLAISAVFSGLIEVLREPKAMEAIGLRFLQIPEYWDSVIYRWFEPRIMGTAWKDLTISVESSIVMVAAGGLMGIKTGLSLLVGAVINYAILVPPLIREGVIEGVGFKYITMWALWGGVAMMTTSSLFTFFSKPGVIVTAFSGILGSKQTSSDILKDVELPMWVFAAGIPIVGTVTVVIGHLFFDVEYLMGLIAIPLVFVFTLIAVNSTGLTSITPSGPLGKLTQLTFSVIAPGNITTNIMTAGITGEVAGNASNLLMDIKPGYMLGGKPRHQAVGHVLGILAGGLVSVPVFYFMFHGDLSLLTSEKFPMPAAQIWAAVAQVLTKGLSFLHPTAQWAILIGAILGIVLELINLRMKGRFPLSGVGIGLAFVIPFSTCLSMALGAILFWALEKRLHDPLSLKHRIFVENRETICAGAIAGGAIMGIALMLLNTMVLT